jgi:general stress protein 26
MSNGDLKKTILDFIASYQYSNLITTAEDGTPRGRMMAQLPVKDDMVIWYATGSQSRKVTEIEKNPTASVFFYRPTDHSSVSALGKAEIVKDDATKKEMWQDAWSAYWKEGPSDPGYGLIKITPQKMEYLDYPNHKQETLEL